jgi:hypothetical protein
VSRNCRSAARNLRRSGIGPEVGMPITGPDTASMWRRYSIVDDDDIEPALDATQYIAERTSAPQSPSNVVAISEARS